LQQVFEYVQVYNQKTGRHVRCYVATHSLPNYAQWCIVSPESSLAQLKGCDGYIAQVWTGTSREPNKYQGDVRSRTFETAFLEYGAMQNLVRSTGRGVWYLNDPIEDNPNHDWTDYRYNWESTLTASLFQPDVWQYEIAPWPERIFNGRYPRSIPSEERKPIPPGYAAELQTVFTALKDMKQTPVKWDCGTPGIGVIVSDSLMFQRGEPTPSDPWLGNFYGLAMPLVKHGLPVAPVQLENVVISNYLAGFKVLFLSYDGQKPLTSEVHAPLAEWVRHGGVLVFCDADADPYLKVRDWWNTGGRHYDTPREHLFELLGLPAQTTADEFHPVGQGGVIWMRERPANLTTSVAGAERVLEAARKAARAVGLDWREGNDLLLRRGPYVIAAGMDESIAAEPKILTGHFVDLFDSELRVTSSISIKPGERHLLRDLDFKSDGDTPVLAAACKVVTTASHGKSLTLGVEGVANTPGVVLLRAKNAPKSIDLAGAPQATFEYSEPDGLLWVRFNNESVPRTLTINF
jgi:hypothetical protein